MKTICADCSRRVRNGTMCLCQQARAYVEKLKPETLSEAKSYARAFWDKKTIFHESENFVTKPKKIKVKRFPGTNTNYLTCCCDYKAEGVCRMTGRHVICEHKKWWQIWK